MSWRQRSSGYGVSSVSRAELEGEVARLRDMRQARDDRLAAVVWDAARRKVVTPEAVAAFAMLVLEDDEGRPITAAAHHALWLRLLCDWRLPKLLIEAPPESAKTTWTILAYLGCRLGVFPEQNVILASKDGPTAEARSLALRLMVRSERWQWLFPDVLPAAGLKWESMRWSLAPNGRPRPGRLHPSIAAYGTGASITGSRADEEVADDILDYVNTRSETERKFINEWVHNSLLSRRKARVGRIVMIGTCWHPDDAYSRAERGGDWVVCKTPLLQEDGDGNPLPEGSGAFAELIYPDDVPAEWRIGEPVGQAEV